MSSFCGPLGCGSAVGVTVGVTVGAAVGVTVGVTVGAAVGAAVGVAVGLAAGAAVTGTVTGTVGAEVVSATDAGVGAALGEGAFSFALFLVQPASVSSIVAMSSRSMIRFVCFITWFLFPYVVQGGDKPLPYGF